MKNNQLKKGELTVNSRGIGTVTPQMVDERAAEIARINDRSPDNVTETDIEQARRELTGESDNDPKEELLESAPESDRWNVPAGSVGHKVVTVSNDDEDDEDRSDNERLVDEGIAGAERDQIVQAAKQADKDE